MTAAERLLLLRDPSAFASIAQMKALGRLYKATEPHKGEKGDPGETPMKGVDYFTPEELEEIVQIIESRIHVPEDGAPGEDGEDGAPGDQGEPGETPLKGVHYWTKADQKAIVSEVRKQVKDGVSPSIEDTVPAILAALRLTSDHIAIKGVEGLSNLTDLVDFLKRGGFRGGGSSATTGSTTFYTQQLVDSGDHKTFTTAHSINTVVSLVDGSGKGLPPKDGLGNVNYSTAGASLTLTSADANLASIGLFIVYV